MTAATPTPVPPATRRRRRSPLIAIVVIVIAVVAIITLAFVLSDNVVYFKTVAEAVDEREADGDRRIRMAGTVVPGSIDEDADGARFELTEGGVTVAVDHNGSTPDLFEECAPLVVEGRWSEVDVETVPPFDSDRILIKHDNEYRAPDQDVPNCPED